MCSRNAVAYAYNSSSNVLILNIEDYKLHIKLILFFKKYLIPWRNFLMFLQRFC